MVSDRKYATIRLRLFLDACFLKSIGHRWEVRSIGHWLVFCDTGDMSRRLVTRSLSLRRPKISSSLAVAVLLNAVAPLTVSNV